MATAAKQFRFVGALLQRYRFYVLLAAMAAGLAVTALEKFRPATIEPLRHRIFVLLDSYLHPTRELVLMSKDFGRSIGHLWEVENEYQELKNRLLAAEADLQATREQLRRLGRISGLRQWESPEELEFVLADVTGFSTEDQSAELLINRGSLDHLEPGLPVVGQRGLVGVIREVAPRTARVQALPDKLSAVGVAEADSRGRGIILGRGRNEPLEFIPENETQPVRPGTVLITSGFRNSVYPKGLIVGTIQSNSYNDQSVEYGVVQPAENLDALEEVLVIRRASHAPPPADEKGLGHFSLDMPTTTTLRSESLTTGTLLFTTKPEPLPAEPVAAPDEEPEEDAP